MKHPSACHVPTSVLDVNESIVLAGTDLSVGGRIFSSTLLGGVLQPGSSFSGSLGLFSFIGRPKARGTPPGSFSL